MKFKIFCKDWLSAWTGNDPTKLRSFYSDQAFYRDPVKPEGLSGDELLPYFTKLLARNPNWVWESQEILETSSGFCLKWKATIPVGSHIVHETGLDIVDIENGKITRNEVYFDRAKLLKAMGS